MYPVILPFFRCGHHLQPDIVVDGGGGHRLVLGVLHGDEIQVLAQQGDHLVHVQTNVRQLLPGGELVVVQIMLPPDELVGNQLFVIRHGFSFFPDQGQVLPLVYIKNVRGLGFFCNIITQNCRKNNCGGKKIVFVPCVVYYLNVFSARHTAPGYRFASKPVTAWARERFSRET